MGGTDAPLLIAATAAIVLAVLVGVALGRRHQHQYVRQNGLFTQAELRFLQTLDAAMGTSYRVHGKVRMADVIAPSSSLRGRKWWRAFTKVSSKHLDFVVVSANGREIIAAIELDDRSHQRRDREARDAFVDKAFRQAGIRLVRFPVQSQYNVADVRSAICGT